MQDPFEKRNDGDQPQPIGVRVMPKDELALKKDSEQKGKVGKVSTQYSCVGSYVPVLRQSLLHVGSSLTPLHGSEQAVEPTEHKQGTVPPAQEKAGYVADSET